MHEVIWSIIINSSLHDRKVIFEMKDFSMNYSFNREFLSISWPKKIECVELQIRWVNDDNISIEHPHNRHLTRARKHMKVISFSNMFLFCDLFITMAVKWKYLIKYQCTFNMYLKLYILQYSGGEIIPIGIEVTTTSIYFVVYVIVVYYCQTLI